ncbi:unnamed protein product [Calicophoron daubneyi]|uniref:Calponin-homology (CH) domain-containing protein n=1 Tax=Calicophoron daubneyi TaxID=300641 RepID=A0AAV2TKY8_CALDB
MATRCAGDTVPECADKNGAFAQFDGELAAKTLRWIRLLPEPEGISEYITNAVKKIPADVQTVNEEQYADFLSDGLALGYLMGSLDTGMLIKLQLVNAWQKPTFEYLETVLQRKRVEIFLQYARAMGVSDEARFSVDQLCKKTNLLMVALCLCELGCIIERKGSFQGPESPEFAFRKTSFGSLVGFLQCQRE